MLANRDSLRHTSIDATESETNKSIGSIRNESRGHLVSKLDSLASDGCSPDCHCIRSNHTTRSRAVSIGNVPGVARKSLVCAALLGIVDAVTAVIA